MGLGLGLIRVGARVRTPLWRCCAMAPDPNLAAHNKEATVKTDGRRGEERVAGCGYEESSGHPELAHPKPITRVETQLPRPVGSGAWVHLTLPPSHAARQIARGQIASRQIVPRRIVLRQMSSADASSADASSADASSADAT